MFLQKYDKNSAFMRKRQGKGCINFNKVLT